MEPHSLVEERGKVVIWVGAWPAASKTNASWPRPPARAGGRGSSLTGGKVGNGMVFSSLSQKGTCSRPSPPSRWAGRYEPFAVRAAGQVCRKKCGLPHTTPTREGVRGGTSSPGVLSPISPKKWGPGRAGQGSLPFQRHRGQTHNAPTLKNAPSSLARPERGRIVSS